MQRIKSTSLGPGAPTRVPAPGAASAVGPKPPKPRPPKNTRDYGKMTPPAPAQQPSPFGPSGDF